MSSWKFAGPLRGAGTSRTLSFAARVGALGFALLSGGCASHSYSPPSWVKGPIDALLQEDAPQRVAQAQAQAQPQPKATSGMRVEIEADGLPAQLAPRHRNAVADDPREPWSPNYGTVAEPVFDQRRLAEKLDAAEPPAPTSARAPAFHPPHARPINGDDLIRQAIAAHEMRRRD